MALLSSPVTTLFIGLLFGFVLGLIIGYEIQD